MRLRSSCLFALVLPLAVAAAAPAVIIDSGDGTGNTSAPSPDPGWSHVGRCNGLGAVYLGGGWVITAAHIGAANTTFDNVLYPWAVGSQIQLHNPDNSLADLVLFRLEPPFPPLPYLVIASAPASSDVDHPFFLIGNGRNRGAATTWNPPGPEEYNGYLWASGQPTRWGTNFAEVATYFESEFDTHVFGSVFDESGSGHSEHESQGAFGDSGGALFAWYAAANQYQLAGILVGIGNYPNQPAERALYGNKTYAADLLIYREEIVETMPEPAGGLFAGAALLAGLTNAGTRRACRGTGSAASSPRRA